MMHRLLDAVNYAEKEYKHNNEAEKITMIFKQADMQQYRGNPLVVKSMLKNCISHGIIGVR